MDALRGKAEKEQELEHSKAKNEMLEEFNTEISHISKGAVNALVTGMNTFDQYMRNDGDTQVRKW